jgi:hypothetical protein
MQFVRNPPKFIASLACLKQRDARDTASAKYQKKSLMTLFSNRCIK